MLQLKEYQQRSLNMLCEYFKLTCKHGADNAFYMVTEPKRGYLPVPQLKDMPYVCLRVPTGGGKTIMASHALGIATRDYVQAEHAVCLWLVPSNVIRDQTLTALRDRQHPYRQALDAHFSGNVRVMDLQEALYLQRPIADSHTVIIVSTLAALRVQDVDGRRIYESSEDLAGHFEGVPAAVREVLETEGEGQVIFSLANVLRLRRPVVIMDEAHNARTKLSFDTLTRFQPSCVIEFTATPVTTHKPEQGYFASNVLHHVSARELKEAEMIKLPIKLRTRPDWKEAIADALQQQRELERLALEEQKETGEYIRPIVLFQAQPQSQERLSLTVATVKQALIDDFRIPTEQIAVATGDTRELDDINLFDPTCQIRFIITVQALKEGWDCSFAYILCSVAEQHSARAVEQILGRVLRMPRASRKRRQELNCAYAFSASVSFPETAKSLQDGLVVNGFERMEAEDLVTAQNGGELTLFGPGLSLFAQASEIVTEQPDLSNLPRNIVERVTFDPASSLLTVQGAINEIEMAELQNRFGEEHDRAAVERIYHRLQGHPVVSTAPTREPFTVPALALYVDGELEFFDDSHFLDSDWNLSKCNPSLSEGEFPSDVAAGAVGEIDISQSGQVETRFVDQLHDQLSLITVEPGWTVAGLANWLDRQIPHPDITQAQSSLFIQNVITNLIEVRGLTLEQLARRKFRLRNAIEAKIASYRDEQRITCYQQTLFGPEHVELKVEPDCCFNFVDDRYSPNWYYEGGWRFNKHYFKLIGELKSEGEEFECARVLDSLSQVKYWVRNVERRPESSFWLQTSTDRFYPDFVAELTDGRYLVIEYKGENLWSNDDSKEKRAVGELWADRSGGSCLFVMPKGRDMAAILDVVK
ncbi:MAG: DEAD/DEAH box helicase [Armatimonadota bacterium]